MNHVCLIGRLTADLEVYESKNKTIYTNFTIAVDGYGDNDADFIYCSAFGKTAEFMEKYVNRKGTRIALEGRINSQNYEDKDGNRRNSTKVIVSSVYFADGRRDNDYDNGQNDSRNNSKNRRSNRR